MFNFGGYVKLKSMYIEIETFTPMFLVCFSEVKSRLCNETVKVEQTTLKTALPRSKTALPRAVLSQGGALRHSRGMGPHETFKLTDISLNPP